jgi:hypothetical protein
MEDSTPSGFSWLTYKAKWRCGVELGMAHVFLFKFNLFWRKNFSLFYFVKKGISKDHDVLFGL